MTPKQRVLKKHPDAFAYAWSTSWCIYRPWAGGNLDLGMGKTAAQAWANAAIRVRSQSTYSRK